MSDLFWLTEAQMTRLEPFFPKSHGKPRVDDRRVLSGIIFINRNGLRWRDAPAAHDTTRVLFRLADGIFIHIHIAHSGLCRKWFRRASKPMRNHDLAASP